VTVNAKTATTSSEYRDSHKAKF